MTCSATRRTASLSALILCPVKNTIIAEYTLRDTTKPIGVAGYTAGRALRSDVRDQLPSPERLEEELRKRQPAGGGGEPRRDVSEGRENPSPRPRRSANDGG